MSTRNLWPAKFLVKVAVVVLLIDQITKLIIINTPRLKNMALMDHLNLRLAYNKGAAFGVLHGAGGWQRWLFVAIALTVITIILIMSLKLSKKDRWEILSLGLILGGALGNLIDRIRLGYVVDFLDFYVGKWHWYTFNIADAAICVGAVLLALYTFFKR